MDIVGVSFGGGSINGQSAKDLPYEQTVGGCSVRYGDVRNGMRLVQINGGMMTTVGGGNSTSMSMGDLSFRSSGDSLWINGAKVDFDAVIDPAVAAAKRDAADRADVTAKARYPGVRFIGTGIAERVDATVTIAPGATINLEGGTEIRGDSVIGSTASVADSKITNSRVDGAVNDTVVKSGSFVGAGATVADCVLEGSTVRNHATVRDSVLKRATVHEQATVVDSVLKGTTVNRGEVLRDFA